MLIMLIQMMHMIRNRQKHRAMLPQGQAKANPKLGREWLGQSIELKIIQRHIILTSTNP